MQRDREKRIAERLIVRSGAWRKWITHLSMLVIPIQGQFSTLQNPTLTRDTAPASKRISGRELSGRMQKLKKALVMDAPEGGSDGYHR
jgi:hypothetical protein